MKYLRLLLVVLLLAGCGKIQAKVDAQSVKSADIPNNSKIGIFYVVSRENSEHIEMIKELTLSQLESKVPNIKRDNQYMFDLITRNDDDFKNLNVELKNHIDKFYFDEGSLPKITVGNIDYILSSNIVSSDVKTKNYTRRKSECLKRNSFLICVEERKWDQECRTVTAGLSVKFKLLDVKTGRVLFTKVLDAKPDDDRCGGDIRSMKTEKEMAREAVDEIVDKLVIYLEKL